MLPKITENVVEQDNNPPPKLFDIPDTISSIVSNEYINREEEDDEDEDQEFSVKISQELFVKILNKTFDGLMTIGFFILFSFYLGEGVNYNIFPFEVNDLNSVWYQAGQWIFLLSYWTTNILLLRILIILAYIFYIIWGLTESGKPSMDFYLFTYIFVVINIKKIVELLYSKRPIIFDNIREKIFIEIFEGIMSRTEYKELINTSLVRDLPKDSFYCKIRDKCNNLSILVKGRLRVFKNSENIKCSFINENEFIDSGEWLLKFQSQLKGTNKRKGRRFNYFIKADDDCLLLTWPREILAEKIKENSELEQKLNAALGIDVSHKLFNNSSLY